MAPAPTMQIFFCFGGAPCKIRARQHLIEHVGEAADAVDHDIDHVMRIAHGAGAERGAAGDDVAGHQRHVLGDRGDQLVRREEHVGDRIVLALLAVQHGLDRQLHRIDAGLDHRAEYAKGVKTLGARPLLERLVLAQQIDRGDVVHAGVAEDVVAGLGFGDVEAFLADDDAEFALVDDLSGIGGRTLDRLARRPIGIRGFQEPERLLRPGKIVLGRELVEIVPQADHLRRIARGADLDLGELYSLPVRLRAGEQIALVNRDCLAFQRAEAGFSTLLETDPFCHLRSPRCGSVIHRAAVRYIVVATPIPAIMHCIIAFPGRSAARSPCGAVRCRAGVPVIGNSKRPGSRFCEAA